MASTKISALPQQYTTTLDDVLAIVDSGYTLTSKATLSTIYESSGSTLNNNTRSLVLAGQGYVTNSNQSIVLGVQSAAGGSIRPGIDGSNTSLVGASFRYSRITGGERNVILGDEDTWIQNGNYNISLGGASNLFYGGYFNGNYSSASSTMSSSNTRAVVVGGLSNSINTLGSNDAVIIGSKSITTTFGSLNAEVSGVYSSVQSGMYPEGFNHTIFNSIYSESRGDGARQSINNSIYGYISGSSNPTCSLVLNSNTGKIQGDFTGQQNAIINSTSSTISGTSNNSRNNTIIGSEGMVISSSAGNAEYITVLGIDGPRTISWNNTTYTDNLHTYKTETFGVTNAGTVGGTFNVDLSLGTLYTFSMSANCSPNFINWREGQRVTFIVNNTGTHTVPTMTITGGGSVYIPGGSANPTNNGITQYNGFIVNGDMYLTEILNFQVV